MNNGPRSKDCVSAEIDPEVGINRVRFILFMRHAQHKHGMAKDAETKCPSPIQELVECLRKLTSVPVVSDHLGQAPESPPPEPLTKTGFEETQSVAHRLMEEIQKGNEKLAIFEVFTAPSKEAKATAATLVSGIKLQPELERAAIEALLKMFLATQPFQVEAASKVLLDEIKNHSKEVNMAVEALVNALKTQREQANVTAQALTALGPEHDRTKAVEALLDAVKPHVDLARATMETLRRIAPFFREPVTLDWLEDSTLGEDGVIKTGREFDSKVGNAVLIVGHQPRLGWIAHALVGEAYPIGQSEILCVDQWEKSLRWVISPSDEKTLEDLREKVRKKMDLAGMLGGFITAGLGFIMSTLADRDKAKVFDAHFWMMLLGLSLLFVGCVVLPAYDVLVRFAADASAILARNALGK